MKKRKKKRLRILICVTLVLLIVIGCLIYFMMNQTESVSWSDTVYKNTMEQVKKAVGESDTTDTNESNQGRTDIKENESNEVDDNGYGKEIAGPTYIKGILIVNKTYALPANFANGNDPTALAALRKLQAGATSAGYSIPLLSGYRSHQKQIELYNRYVARDGKDAADTYSARPGHSEHETGLTFDIGSVDDNYGNTSAGKWLAEHCHEYGFIIRYPKGKESITKYQYEPWHVRYVGVKAAEEIHNKNITLEEYLGIA